MCSLVYMVRSNNVGGGEDNTSIGGRTVPYRNTVRYIVSYRTMPAPVFLAKTNTRVLWVVESKQEMVGTGSGQGRGGQTELKII